MPDAPREPAAPICDAAGFVLAGGQSTRMGRDKALLAFDRRPLIEHVLATLHEAGLSASIAGANPSVLASLAAFAPVVEDLEPGRGPLAGVCAALASTTASYAVFLPVDLPLLPSSLIVYLLQHARITGHAVTVPSVNGFAETFPAILHRSILPALENELRSDRSGCFAAFQAAAAVFGQSISILAVELLAQSGQVVHPLGLLPVHWFLNVNTPENLQHAEAVVARNRVS
jgi:molybdopterin-guanine dinucleotide biosynthesis protein A